ncbi:MAG: hypothetical protein ACRDAM_21680, partial [Casimicrobium sp.]
KNIYYEPMIENRLLETYWISFPADPNLPWGIGVTALSAADAFNLIEERNIGSWFIDASEVHIKKGVGIADLDRNVVPNIGPLQFYGIWYPAMNIGFGSPSDAGFKKFNR